MFIIYFIGFLLLKSYNLPSYLQNVAFASDELSNISQSITNISCSQIGPYLYLYMDNYYLRCDYKIYALRYIDNPDICIDCTSTSITITLSQPTENLDYKMKNIISTLSSRNKFDVFFVGFSDPDSVFKYGDYFQQSDITMWMQIAKYPNNCLWDYEFDYVDKWGSIESTSNWHFSCIGNIAYLHYNSADEPIEGKIVFLSTATTILIICMVLLAVIVLIISFCLVARCRYIKLTGLD